MASPAAYGSELDSRSTGFASTSACGLALIGTRDERTVADELREMAAFLGERADGLERRADLEEPHRKHRFERLAISMVATPLLAQPRGTPERGWPDATLHRSFARRIVAAGIRRGRRSG